MRPHVGGHSLLPMTFSDGDRHASGQPISASTVVWNAVLPVLGLALVLGAPMLPAFAIAAGLTAAIYAVLMPESHPLGVISGSSRASGPQRARR